MNKKIINLLKSPLDTWSINDHTGKVSVNQEHTVEARQTLPNKGPFSPRCKGRRETTPKVWKILPNVVRIFDAVDSRTPLWFFQDERYI